MIDTLKSILFCSGQTKDSSSDLNFSSVVLSNSQRNLNVVHKDKSPL